MICRSTKRIIIVSEMGSRYCTCEVFYIVYKVSMFYLLSVKSAIAYSYYQAKQDSGGGMKGNFGNETYTVVFEACKKHVLERMD